MIAIAVELVIMLLLAWSITYLTYVFETTWKKIPLIQRNEIKLEKKEVDRITDIFYRYFYIYVSYFIISNFFIINHIDNVNLFHSIGVAFAIFFLYLQSYVIYRWKVIIKFMKTKK